jgi:hypothetical protein
MIQVTLWLLISVGTNYSDGSPSRVIERFPSSQECEKVAASIRNTKARYSIQPVVCVEATVLVAK